MFCDCSCRGGFQGPGDNRVGTLVVETEEDKWVYKVRTQQTRILRGKNPKIMTLACVRYCGTVLPFVRDLLFCGGVGGRGSLRCSHS